MHITERLYKRHNSMSQGRALNDSPTSIGTKKIPWRALSRKPWVELYVSGHANFLIVAQVVAGPAGDSGRRSDRIGTSLERWPLARDAAVIRHDGRVSSKLKPPRAIPRGRPSHSFSDSLPFSILRGFAAELRQARLATGMVAYSALVSVPLAACAVRHRRCGPNRPRDWPSRSAASLTRAFAPLRFSRRFLLLHVAANLVSASALDVRSPGWERSPIVPASIAPRAPDIPDCAFPELCLLPTKDPRPLSTDPLASARSRCRARICIARPCAFGFCARREHLLRDIGTGLHGPALTLELPYPRAPNHRLRSAALDTFCPSLTSMRSSSRGELPRSRPNRRLPSTDFHSRPRTSPSGIHFAGGLRRVAL